MNNILDYLSWRGDLSFERVSLCEADFLIFAQLVHAPLERLDGDGRGGSLSQLKEKVYPCAPGKDANGLIRSRYELWLAAMQCARFSSVTLERFDSHFEPEAEKQFAAALFQAGGVGVVCYRGTDATLTGWKEDFNMAFESPVPSQTEAVAFLNEAAQAREPLYACGHSKGGNLAMYAASMAEPTARERLLGVYSFDGPGLDDRTRDGDGYRAVSPRIRAYIPESSVIGLLLGYPDAFTVVQSDSVSLWQHNPYYWHVLGPGFERAESTTRSSRFTDRALHSFLAGCPPEERRLLVDTLFGILSATGASKLRELPRGVATHLDEILSALKSVPPDSRRALTRSLKLLAGAGAESLGILLGEESPRE